MKFIFDECVSFRIAQALKTLQKDVAPYFDHWHRGAEDLEWIPDASENGYCVVTSDKLRRPHEREALKHHKGRIIVLATANLRFWDVVKFIIKRWENIETAVRRRKPPFILRFTTNSSKPKEIS